MHPGERDHIWCFISYSLFILELTVFLKFYIYHIDRYDAEEGTIWCPLQLQLLSSSCESLWAEFSTQAGLKGPGPSAPIPAALGGVGGRCCHLFTWEWLHGYPTPRPSWEASPKATAAAVQTPRGGGRQVCRCRQLSETGGQRQPGWGRKQPPHSWAQCADGRHVLKEMATGISSDKDIGAHTA